MPPKSRGSSRGKSRGSSRGRSASPGKSKRKRKSKKKDKEAKAVDYTPWSIGALNAVVAGDPVKLARVLKFSTTGEVDVDEQLKLVKDPTVKPGDRAQLYVLKKPPRMIEPPPPRQADEEHWTPLIVLEADHEAAEHARDLKEAWRKPRYEYEWVAGEIMEIHPSHPPTFSVRNSESDTIERKVPGHRVRVNVDVRARRFKSKRAKARDKEGADGALEKLFEVLDVNKDGVLTRSEVISGARAIRKTRDEAAELFDKLDINGDGVLDLDEFGAGVKGPPDMAMHDGNMIVLHSEPTVAYNSIEFKVTDYFKTMKLGDAECGGSTQYGRNLLLPAEKHDTNKLIGTLGDTLFHIIVKNPNLENRQRMLDVLGEQESFSPYTLRITNACVRRASDEVNPYRSLSLPKTGAANVLLVQAAKLLRTAHERFSESALGEKARVAWSQLRGAPEETDPKLLKRAVEAVSWTARYKRMHGRRSRLRRVEVRHEDWRETARSAVENMRIEKELEIKRKADIAEMLNAGSEKPKRLLLGPTSLSVVRPPRADGGMLGDGATTDRGSSRSLFSAGALSSGFGTPQTPGTMQGGGGRGDEAVRRRGGLSRRRSRRGDADGEGGGEGRGGGAMAVDERPKSVSFGFFGGGQDQAQGHMAADHALSMDMDTSITSSLSMADSHLGGLISTELDQDYDYDHEHGHEYQYGLEHGLERDQHDQFEQHGQHDHEYDPEVERMEANVIRIVRASQERSVLMSLNDEVFTPDCLVDAMHTMRLAHSMTRKVEKERGMGWFDKQVSLDQTTTATLTTRKLSVVTPANPTDPTTTTDPTDTHYHQREVEKGLSEAARHELMKSMRDAAITPPTITTKAWSGGDDGDEDGVRGGGADGPDGSGEAEGGTNGADGSATVSDRFRGASPPPLSYVGSSPTASKPSARKPWQPLAKKKRRQGVDRMTRSAIKEAFAKQRRAGEAQRRIYAEVEGGRQGSHR